MLRSGVAGLMAVMLGLGVLLPAQAAVEFGTSSDDRLRGTMQSDYLAGRAGDDVLHGRGDFDELYGGVGDDVLYGGALGDEMEGGPGDDVLIGGGGDDWISDRSGTSKVWPGRGWDMVMLSSGSNVIVLKPDGAGDGVWCGSGRDLVLIVRRPDPRDDFHRCERLWLVRDESDRPSSGTRLFVCDYAVATIVGTPGRDRIHGTPRRDVIVAAGVATSSRPAETMTSSALVRATTEFGLGRVTM